MRGNSLQRFDGTQMQTESEKKKNPTRTSADTLVKTSLKCTCHLGPRMTNTRTNRHKVKTVLSNKSYNPQTPGVSCVSMTSKYTYLKSMSRFVEVTCGGSTSH